MLVKDEVWKLREKQLHLLLGMSEEQNGKADSIGYSTTLGFHYGRISALCSVLGEDDSYNKLLRDIEQYKISQGIIKEGT